MGAMRGGGGGFAGKINYPQYMKTFHENYLINNAENLIPLTLAGSSPYNTAYAYDPDGAIDASQTVIDDFNTLLEGIDPSVLVSQWLADAASEIDGAALPDTYIDDQVTAYELSQEPTYLRSVNSFTGPMSDLNAVHNTAFIIGLGILEAQFDNSVAGFSAQLRAQRDSQRYALLGTITGQMAALYQVRVTSGISVISSQMEQARFQVASKQNQYDKDLEIDVRDVFFDFDVLDRGGAVLGSINGAPSNTNAPGPMQQIASTGLSAIGTILPMLTAL